MPRKRTHCFLKRALAAHFFDGPVQTKCAAVSADHMCCSQCVTVASYYIATTQITFAEPNYLYGPWRYQEP